MALAVDCLVLHLFLLLILLLQSHSCFKGTELVPVSSVVTQ